MLWKYFHVNTYDLLYIFNYFIRMTSMCEIAPLKDMIFKKAYTLLL